jgi:aspartokinase-like uncharacterized kinase
MWVVKLGGSLTGSPELSPWLACLAEHGGGRIAVVPGGGPFADAVRQVQQHWKFPDPSAHRMACLAMDQYGWMLMGLEPRFRPASDLSEIRARLMAKEVPVWLPGPTMGDHPDIPQSWDITSDSLAAWLARRLGARYLVLVKSISPPAGEVSVEELCRRGVVDSAFHGFLAGVDFKIVWLGREDHGVFTRILNGAAA